MRLIVGPWLLYPFKKVLIFFYGENQINQLWLFFILRRRRSWYWKWLDVSVTTKVKYYVFYVHPHMLLESCHCCIHSGIIIRSCTCMIRKKKCKKKTFLRVVFASSLKNFCLKIRINTFCTLNTVILCYPNDISMHTSMSSPFTPVLLFYLEEFF